MYAESDADFEQYAANSDAFLSGGEALYKIGNVEMARGCGHNPGHLIT